MWSAAFFLVRHTDCSQLWGVGWGHLWGPSFCQWLVALPGHCTHICEPGSHILHCWPHTTSRCRGGACYRWGESVPGPRASPSLPARAVGHTEGSEPPALHTQAPRNADTFSLTRRCLQPAHRTWSLLSRQLPPVLLHLHSTGQKRHRGFKMTPCPVQGQGQPVASQTFPLKMQLH